MALTLRVTLAIGLIAFLTLPALAQDDDDDDDDDIFPPVATTVQLPTFGVAIDAEGVLQVKHFADPGGRLRAERAAAAKRRLPGDVAARSKLRKISLVRLEQALARRLAAGESPDDAMQHLAGLLRVRYVFLLPDEKDIVIAGPAEGWLEDASGRAVGITTGRPVLELADLAAALRTFAPGTRERPFVGCTIDPDPEALKRLVEVQKKLPRVVPAAQRQRVAAELQQASQEALGLANVRVFGVPANTNMAQVMVEADYRMKLIGIGLEPPPVKMATFISSLGTPKELTLQRWWFTPNYRMVRVAEGGAAMQLIGQGVQLQTEDKTIGPGGKLMATGAPPSAASQAYSEAFTKNYPAIAQRSPVFAQLRNMVDLLVVAAFLRQHDYYGQAAWDGGALLSEEQLAIETERTPKQVACAVNTFWRGSRLLSPAGGGVSIVPTEALAEEHLVIDKEGSLLERRKAVVVPDRIESWWWD